MPKFEYIGGGTHESIGVKGKQTRYKKGDVFDDPHDLDKMFANKFRRIEFAPAPIQVAPPPPEVKEEKKEPENKKKIKVEKVTDPRGEETVFDIDEELKAFTKGNDLFFVYEGDKPEPLNKKPIPRDQVEAWAKKYMEG